MNSPSALIYAKPYLLGILNTWFQTKLRHKLLIRLAALSLFIVFILMLLKEQLLGRQANPQTISNFNLFNPLILQFYWSLLLIAGSISAIFQIYQSKKTDYILRHPFYPGCFYFSTVFQLIISLGFISLTIGVPLWIIHLKMSASLIGAPAALLTLIVINLSAASWAVLLALIVGPLAMHSLGRKILLGLLFATVFSIFLFAARLQDPGQREIILNEFQMFSSNAQPVFLEKQFSGFSKITLGKLPDFSEITIIVVFLLLPLIPGILLIKNYFHKLYEISQNFRNKSLQAKSFLVKLFLAIPWKSQKLMLISKEYQLLLRDALNIFQLLLILLVLLVYVLSLLNLPQLSVSSAGSQELLKAVLIAVNYMAVLLIVSVIAARFAFPAFSVENGSFWLITSSALSLKNYYQAKFTAWFIIIMLIAGSGIFISNYIILDSCMAAALLSVPSLFTVYGLVALAFGLGGYFIKLDWENITDLTSSFGNFMYLLGSFIFIILNLIPTVFLILLQSYAITDNILSYSFNELFFYISILSLIIYFNLLTGKFCRELALRSIERKILS